MRGKPSVRTFGPHKVKKMANKLPREKLREIRQRSGYSGSQLAKELGYSSPTGYLHYEQEQYQDDRQIPYAVIKKLIPMLQGRGTPPITAEELILLTDAQEMSVPNQQAFVNIVTDGDGLLAIKYRVEPGTYVKLSQPRVYGASRLGTNPLYQKGSQFAVAVSASDMRSVRQLQCVERDKFPEALTKGRRVIVAVAEGSDLVEIVVGTIGSDGVTPYGDNGKPCVGKTLGVVVGAYVPE